MRKIRLLLPVLAVCMAFSFSCKKEEIIVIPDNTAPPDTTVEIVTIENYVNRAYIALLGRKPEPAEFTSGFSALDNAKFTEASRQAFLDGLLGMDEYNMNLFLQGKSRYLNGVDTSEIKDNINLINLLLMDPQYAPLYAQLTEERNRLQLVMDIPSDLNAGTLDVSGMHRRMVWNFIYDQINMGTQNFVVSNFQHFLLRYPTSFELDNAQQMVDGIAAVLFLTQGQSKTDFLDIFFGSSDYYEGQVRDVFLHFLFREPSAEEIDTYSDLYKNGGTYGLLLKTLLSTDEYAGL